MMLLRGFYAGFWGELMSFMRMAIIAGLATGLMSGVVEASTLRFTTSGADSTSFTLSSNPVPSDSGPDGFDISNVDVTVRNQTVVADLAFYKPSFGGGYSVLVMGQDDAAFTGPQIFSGTTAQPQFAPGVIMLTDVYNDTTVTLTISAVPLPASAPLFGAALLALGVVRGLRRTAAVA